MDVKEGEDGSSERLKRFLGSPDLFRSKASFFQLSQLVFVYNLTYYKVPNLYSLPLD